MEKSLFREYPPLLAARALRQNGYYIIRDSAFPPAEALKEEDIPGWNFGVIALSNTRVYVRKMMGLYKRYLDDIKIGYTVADISIGCAPLTLPQKWKYRGVETPEDQWDVSTYDITHARRIYDILNKVIEDNQHNLPEKTFLKVKHVADKPLRFGEVYIGSGRLKEEYDIIS